MLDELDPWPYEPAPDFPQARCGSESPEIFFMDQKDSGVYATPAQLDSVKRICRGCPHRRDCLAWAVENRVVGIWGGTTTAERRLMVA